MTRLFGLMTNDFPVALVLQEPLLESENVLEVDDNHVVKRDALREPRAGPTPRCLADEFFDWNRHTCHYCTRCMKGFQHRVSDPEREACGFGHGTSLHCDPCPDGFYQDRADYHILRCKPCSSCAPGAEVVQGCTKQRNTICGQSCPPGWFPHDIGCIKCTHRTDHQNCRQVTLTPGGTVVMKTTLPPIVRTTTQSPSQGLQHFSPSPTQEAPSEVPATGKSKLAWSNLGTILLIVGGIIAVIVFLCIWYYRRNHTNRCRRISAQDKSVDGHISTGDVWTGVPTSPSETSR
ncbi:uncharacterized protein [Diadema antillarum]|uniref:uncharacterized protein n=1 Tax=Diadema antillarum TaxID=105358 RepID=UPI003A8A5641